MSEKTTMKLVEKPEIDKQAVIDAATIISQFSAVARLCAAASEEGYRNSMLAGKDFNSDVSDALFVIAEAINGQAGIIMNLVED